MKYFKKLVRERIYLSPRNSSDVEKFTEWLNDFETTDYTGRSDSVVTLDEEQKYFESEPKLNARYFVIVTLEKDEMIGTISLEKIRVAHRTAELGIFIGNKDYRSKGYGAEAIRLLLDFGFNYLNLNSIRLDLLEFNERALKCYKKCGFKEYGRQRKCRFINGKYYDIISMDILAEEFKEDAIKNKNI